MQLKKDGEMSEEEMQEMLGTLYPKRKKGKNNKKELWKPVP